MQKIKFTKREIRQIVSGYKRGESVSYLADVWSLTTPSVIRRILVAAGVKIRGRGRPRDQ